MGSRLLPWPTNLAKLELELKSVMCGNPTIALEAMLRNPIISHTAVSNSNATDMMWDAIQTFPKWMCNHTNWHQIASEKNIKLQAKHVPETAATLCQMRPCAILALKVDSEEEYSSTIDSWSKGASSSGGFEDCSCCSDSMGLFAIAPQLLQLR